MPITTDDLVNQVRDQIDESNSEDVTTDDILQCLNRAQRKAAGILAKHCEDLLIASTTATSTGSEEFDIPEDAYGRRIESVIHTRNNTEYPLARVNYRDLHKYSTQTQVQVPTVYAIKGRKYVVKPTPATGVTLKVWYTKAPETLVLPQGRITTVNDVSTYVLVDALGSDLTTSTSGLGAYVNIVDAQTGEIKVSLQTAALNTSTKKVSFKTTALTRSSVLNRTIDVAIPTTVAEDDYVCAIQGTCVPDLPDSCLDFLVQYAVYEIRRRMGESVQDEAAMLNDLEQEVERQWAGRESSRRIANKSKAWTRY